MTKLKSNACDVGLPDDPRDHEQSGEVAGAQRETSLAQDNGPGGQAQGDGRSEARERRAIVTRKEAEARIKAVPGYELAYTAWDGYRVHLYLEPHSISTGITLAPIRKRDHSQALDMLVAAVEASK